MCVSMGDRKVVKGLERVLNAEVSVKEAGY